MIINATIRNDYTEEWFFGYFISLTAYLYKIDGQKVGTVYTYNQNFCGMVEDKLQVGETKTYEICVAYDKQDIQYYEQYVWNIQRLPTP